MQGETPQTQQGEHTATAHKEEPTNPSAPLQQEDPAVSAENAANPAKRRRYWEAFKDRGFSRTMEALITGATVVNVWIAIEQRDAMEDANKRADQAIERADVANRIALNTLIASQRQAESDKKQREADRQDAARLAETERTDRAAQFKETIQTSREQAEASRELVRQDLQQAEFAREAFQRQHRARLGITEWTHEGDLGTTGFKFTATLTNTGTSPAERINLTNGRQIGHGSRTEPTQNDPLVATLGSQDSIKHFLRWAQPLDPYIASQITSGVIPLKIYIVMTYGDQFQEQYPSETFCFRWLASEKAFGICTESEAETGKKQRP